MCILFIYRNPDAGVGSYKFILASNRDEFYNRPAKIADFWENRPDCIGGLDMEPGKEGGTWLAASIKGRAAVLLNLTGETRESNVSGMGRGSLVTDYLKSPDSTLDFLNELHEVNQEQRIYNPFTLVVAELRSADVYCLTSSLNAKSPERCRDEILGFGNSGLMTRPYRKVEVGKERFKKIVENATTTDKENLVRWLLEFLKCKEKHLPDPELVKRSPENFDELSSIFVDHKIGQYGTRTHTIILVDGSDELTFIEETLMPDRKWHYQSLSTKLQ